MFIPTVSPGVSLYFQEFEATLILYVLTAIYAKIRCSNLTLKDVMKKSFIPISLFIGLSIFSIIGGFIDNPYVMIAHTLLTNMFVWLGLGFLIYRPIFNKVFEEGKC